MKVLVIDSVHPILYEKLREANFQVDELTHLNKAEILAIIHEYEGIIIRSKFKVDKEVLDAAAKLKFIARSGSGMENIDIEYADNKNIVCFNSPEGNRDAVAEHALGMILSLFNHLNRCDNEVRNGIWLREQNRGLELKSKTVAIIGFGVMGQALVQRLAGFDVNLLIHDKYKMGFEYESNLGAIFEKADIVSLHLPLTDETQHYFDAQFIDQFKKPIYLINTSRGACVKTDDLLKALKSKKVLGACLDVLEYESTSFGTIFENETNPTLTELLQQDNVLFSPHVAGWSHESYLKLSTFLAEKILKEF